MTSAGPPPSPRAKWLDRIPVSARWVLFFLGVAGTAVGALVGVPPLFGAKLDDVWAGSVFITLCVVFVAVIFVVVRHFNDLFRSTSDETAKLREDTTRLQEQMRQQTENFRQQIDAVVHQTKSVELILGTARRLNDDIAALNGEEINRERLLRFVETACHGLNDAYERFAIKNRVCLKEAKADEHTGDLYVLDLYRTNKSVDLNNRVQHLVTRNTDFDSIYNGNSTEWFTGNLSELSKKGLYKSSSETPATYESVIVWPVYSRQPQGGQLLNGFLCIDSEIVNAFSMERDIPTGWMIADALSRVFENHRR